VRRSRSRLLHLGTLLGVAGIFGAWAWRALDEALDPSSNRATTTKLTLDTTPRPAVTCIYDPRLGQSEWPCETFQIEEGQHVEIDLRLLPTAATSTAR
jgi:hypothetical protein